MFTHIGNTQHLWSHPVGIRAQGLMQVAALAAVFVVGNKSSVSNPESWVSLSICMFSCDRLTC